MSNTTAVLSPHLRTSTLGFNPMFIPLLYKNCGGWTPTRTPNLGFNPMFIPLLYEKCGGEPRVKPGVWRPEMWALGSLCVGSATIHETRWIMFYFLFNPNPHCFIAISKAKACGWKEPLLPHPHHSPALSQKHFQCMKRFQNYLETFPKLLGNIEEVEISK
jgi:hypothetical protein